MKKELVDQYQKLLEKKSLATEKLCRGSISFESYLAELESINNSMLWEIVKHIK